MSPPAPKTVRRPTGKAIPIIAKSPAEIDRLVRSCMAMAYKTSRRYSMPGLLLEDIVAGANMGLVLAAQRFDPSRHLKFSTYAIFWIRAGIFMAIETSAGKRLSADERKAFYRTAATRDRMRARGIENPTDAELAAEIGIKERAFFSLRARSMVSIDAHVPGTNVAFSSTGLVMDDEHDPEKLLGHAQARSFSKKRLKWALRQLAKRDRYVVEQRYCVSEPRTLASIAVSLGVSRERARQIALRALARLRKTLARDRAELELGG